VVGLRDLNHIKRLTTAKHSLTVAYGLFFPTLSPLCFPFSVVGLPIQERIMRDPSFWNVTVPRLLSTYAIVIFAMLWIGFAIALVVNREWLDLLWNWVRALPSVTEIAVWVLFLPGMVGLWVWESSWSAFVRLLVWGAIVGWTLIAVVNFLRSVR
jgi:hypothetical protein